MDIDWTWLIGGIIAGAILAYIRVSAAPTIATPGVMRGAR